MSRTTVASILKYKPRQGSSGGAADFGMAHIPLFDALRGYAILLVIASHAFPSMPELPWTIKRFTNLGFFGVQLFFVTSCITLTRSSRARCLNGETRLVSFLLRRFFRIAPGYYLAAILYLALYPTHPSWVQIATFITFTNGWSPGLMPTEAGVWVGVPGGWSIEAEAAFYLLFPWLLTICRNWWRSAALLLISLPLGYVLDAIARTFFTQYFAVGETDQFLYYWLPNQLPVFLCGFVTANILMDSNRWSVLQGQIAARSGLLLTVSGAMFLALGLVPLPRMPFPSFAFVSSPLVAALAFCGGVMSLASRNNALIVNGLMVRLGRVSFSAYLIHFAVIEMVLQAIPKNLVRATGVSAIGISVVIFLAATVITGFISVWSFQFIETPAIRLGNRLSVALRV